MLSLRETRIVEDLSECTGRIMPSLTVDPPPCTVMLDNTPLERK